MVDLAVHLESGQLVYFNKENPADRAARPPSNTLTSCFSVCQTDVSARTLHKEEFPHRKQGTPVE